MIKRGQVSIEVTFSMIVIVILLLAMVRVFFWVGEDLASRRQAQETSLLEFSASADPNDRYRELRPVVFESVNLDTSFNSEIFGIDRLGN